jgi:type 1 glutamine amidotransferase
MAATDLVVQCISMGEASGEHVAGLRHAVAAGTGFTGWHGGIVDSFRMQADYLQLVGGQFASHPSQPVPGSEEITVAVEHTVEFTDLGREHPITAGIDDIALRSEQYWVLTDDLNDVLATTTHPVQPQHPWHRAVACPAIWTREWGSGRIVVTTPGHEPETLLLPAVRGIVERGMLWATRRPLL